MSNNFVSYVIHHHKCFSSVGKPEYYEPNKHQHNRTVNLTASSNHLINVTPTKALFPKEFPFISTTILYKRQGVWFIFCLKTHTQKDEYSSCTQLLISFKFLVVPNMSYTISVQTPWSLCSCTIKSLTLSVVWRWVASISTGQVPFLIFRGPLAMLFSGWVLLSVCQDKSTCNIEVKCLDDELSCINTWPLIYAWPLSPHQKYMATGLLNMQWPIFKLEEDQSTGWVFSGTCWFLCYFSGWRVPPLFIRDIHRNTSEGVVHT